MCGADLKDYVLLLVGALLSVLNGALLPLNSLIFKGISDALINGERNFTENELDMDVFSSDILYYCSLYFILGAGLLVNGYLANASLFTFCERRIHYIRAKYLRAVLRQDMAWFDTQQTGALTMKMSSGVERIKDGIGDKLGLILAALGSFFSGLENDVGDADYCTAAADCFLYLCKETYAYSSAASLANEVIAGIRTVIAFNAQPFEIHRYEKELKTARKLGIRKAFVMAIFSAVSLFLMFAIMAVSFWYGTTLVLSDSISPGTVFAVFWSVLLGTRRLGEAIPQMGAIIGAKMATSNIFSIINRVPDIDSLRDDGLAPEEFVGRITFTHIHFHYPTRPSVKVLRDVTYEVAIDDIPLRDYSINWLRKTIGVVQQEPIIFAATVSENIRMGDDSLTDEDVEDACRIANALEFIRKLSDGFNTVIGEGAVQLSGGQKQRIAIARALIKKPQILLLDEATSALDTESEQAVQAALDKAKENRTTLCIAHRLSTIRNAAKIIVFDKGRIVEQGTHDELMAIKDGIYHGMVNNQKIEKGNEDTTLDDVTPLEMQRGFLGGRVTSEADLQTTSELSRESTKLRCSMISTSTQEPQWEIESARGNMREEGGMEASLLDIFAYAKPELPMAVVAMFFTILRGLTWPIFSIIYGKLFLLMSDPDPKILADGIIINSVLFMLLAIASGITTFCSGSLYGITGEKMAMRLRMDVFKNIMRQDVSYFDDPKHNTGTLTTRLASDAPNVQAAIDQRLAEVMQGVCALIAGIIVAFCYGWNIALCGLVTALALVIAQSSVAQYLKFRGQKDMDSAIEASRIVTESISNVRTIQALCKEGYMHRAYCAAAREPHRRALVRGNDQNMMDKGFNPFYQHSSCQVILISVHSNKWEDNFLLFYNNVGKISCLWQSLSLALANSFVVTNFAISYAFGLWLVKNGWSTPFTIFQVIEALNMASMSMMTAASYFPEYIRARISAGVMFTMMHQRPKVDNMSHQGEKPDIKGDIALRNVYFAYPSRQRALVLQGMNISARYGQTVALVGASGCGKSTVIQLLERYYDALCGKVTIDGYDIRDLSIRHVRDHVALVGQEPTLFNMTIRENIMYGMGNCSQEEIEHAARLANIHDFIASLPEGYSTMVGAKGGLLSGGQKQRIAIARAIVRDPKILLLDEATSALDAESEKVVQDALDRAKLGRTCVVIAHRLSSIQVVQDALDRAKLGRTCVVIAHRLSSIQNANHIVVCREGRAAESGTHQTLLARKGIYYKLVEGQNCN
ncbi:ABC transporter, ATP-binding protein [Dictyocaulus viviparus]|uniref:ABC-type xenobiotic transporter n=1 Tax=Dictyocaulus viviparus TaxID=29172 RepID=A0A0D8XVR7_DICVI|nr:ABC transporter, ATP-binding protein [Dictyocaulus viviparus]